MLEIKTLAELGQLVEGCVIRRLTLQDGMPPCLLLELETRTERTLELRITPQALPALNGNILTISPALNFNVKGEEK